MWAYFEKVYQDVEQQPNAPNFDGINSTDVERTIEKINTAIKDKPVDKKVK